MSTVTATPPAGTAPTRARHAAAPADQDGKPRHAWIWTLLEALAYSGALFDPTGTLAAQRFARAPEEHRSGGRG